MTNCEKILKQKEPMMSGELVALLVSQNGLVANTASKTIVRDKTVHRITRFKARKVGYNDREKNKIKHYSNR